MRPEILQGLPVKLWHSLQQTGERLHIARALIPNMPPEQQLKTIQAYHTHHLYQAAFPKEKGKRFEQAHHLFDRAPIVGQFHQDLTRYFPEAGEESRQAVAGYLGDLALVQFMQKDRAAKFEFEYETGAGVGGPDFGGSERAAKLKTVQEHYLRQIQDPIIRFAFQYDLAANSESINPRKFNPLHHPELDGEIVDTAVAQAESELESRIERPGRGQIHFYASADRKKGYSSYSSLEEPSNKLVQEKIAARLAAHEKEMFGKLGIS